MNMVNDRWEIAEKIIATNAWASVEYAIFVIRGRFELGEKVILEDAEESCWYACDVLRERWLEAEPIIMNSDWAEEYTRKFGKL